MLKKVTLGESLALADKKYSFSIESLAADSVVETIWKNNSENLLQSCPYCDAGGR